MMDKNALLSIAAQFNLKGSIEEISQLGEGHIHATYLVTGSEQAYVLQQFNHKVFPQPYEVAENILMVARHMKDRFQKSNVSDYWRKYLPPISLKNASHTLFTHDDSYWRMFPYIQHSYVLQTVESSDQAYEAAKLVGCFQALLSDFPIRGLHTTLPDFLHVPVRYQQFLAALRRSSGEKKLQAKEAIGAIETYHEFILNDPVYQNEEFLPLRVTHNDTKINNALLDTKTHTGLCMIDLDTVMPGYSIHDFGDMIRTFCSPVDENSKELERIAIRMPIFEALCKGYLEEAGGFLTDREKENLLHGGKQMILITAIRFLTDFLAGDVYYRTYYKGQNLDRARNQLTLLEKVHQQEVELQKIIKQYS
ncbi:MAG: aminoglycoside phosphotransferase family protein [Bacteroidota bacterium]